MLKLNILYIRLLTLRLHYARAVHFRVFCKEYCNLGVAILYDIFSKIMSLRFNLWLHSCNFKKNLFFNNIMGSVCEHVRTVHKK